MPFVKRCSVPIFLMYVVQSQLCADESEPLLKNVLRAFNRILESLASQSQREKHSTTQKDKPKLKDEIIRVRVCDMV